MLHIENKDVRAHLLSGCFGLEKESLRVLSNGRFAHTPHPFPEDPHIVKDFCENQTEINTGVHTSIRGAVRELAEHNRRIYRALAALPEREYLWPFSNPPYISNEEDIPVAVYEGVFRSKTAYRNYLADKYGRYKMTFSGIHVNYSFGEQLLQADFAAQGAEGSFRAYKDRLYLTLARRMAAYGWILVAVTAASPLLDSSFVEKGVYDTDVFTGMASVRCSELGYWNEFCPIFDYSGVRQYADGIRRYLSSGLLQAPSELYYPIRLKPAGENSLDGLCENGINHIELRMFDLNPLTESGVEERDILFAQLLMLWLAATPDEPFTEKDQIQVVQNLKNGARYDLKTVTILTPQGDRSPVTQAAMEVIDRMRAFYQTLGLPVQEVLDFEYEKFVDGDNRYAWQIRERFRDGYVQKGLALAIERQRVYHV